MAAGRAASAKRTATSNAADGTQGASAGPLPDASQGNSVSGDTDDGEELEDDDYDSDEAAETFLAQKVGGGAGRGTGNGDARATATVVTEEQGEADESERQAARALLEGLRQRARMEAEDKVVEHFSRPGTARSRPGTACSTAGTL